MQVDNLINGLVKRKILKNRAIIKAFRKIDRKDFIPSSLSYFAYENRPLSIGCGQTISQPETVAIMLEKLEPKKGQKILDAGSGSGWTTALLSEIVGKSGKVYGLELIFDLCQKSRENISKYNYLASEVADIIEGDAYFGLPDKAPFDRILVSAAAPKIPLALLHQLAENGRLVMPIGKLDASQDIIIVHKLSDGSFSEERLPDFRFVPLVKQK